MLILKLAFRNLFRYEKRTIITALAIAVGLIFYIFMDSLLLGWYERTERQYVEYEVASGKIVSTAWWEEKNRKPLDKSLEETDKLNGLLAEMGIEYSGRIEFQADLIFYQDPYPESGSFPAIITALDPEKDGVLFKLAEAMDNEHSRGEFLAEGDEGIVVGTNLAKKLGMEIGYPIELLFTNRSGYKEVLTTRVMGIIQTENHLLNLSGIFLSLDTAREYLEMEDCLTGISIKMPDNRRGEALKEELRTRLPEGTRLLGYEDLAADFMDMQELENGFAGLFMFLIFLIAAVGISNTMMMAIFERRREIGMMRAQGFPDRKIQIMLFLEAGAIGLLGAAAGLAGGALANIPLVKVGINYGAMLKTSEDFVDFGSVVIDSHMKGIWHLPSYIKGGFFVIVVSSLAAFFPVRRLLKKTIPDNLRRDE